jgi:peroxiredoxin
LFIISTYQLFDKSNPIWNINMALATQLNEVLDNFGKNAPESVVKAIAKSRSDFASEFKPEDAIQVGQTLPSFDLPNAVGEQIKSTDLLSKGPLLITFYRGEWCPFCNLAIAMLQKKLPEFQARGVTLVAISPELPNQSLSTVEKHQLKFPVLTDQGNNYARQLGIVWAQPEELRPIFKTFGHDFVKRNGDDSFEVPVPATILVDKNGVIRNTFIDPDYAKRCEPQTAIDWIDAMNA